jgi:hypothetical protein
MESFGTYYNERFRNDLQQFFAGIPDKSKHHDNYDKRTYHIQYERLTKDKTHLDFLKTHADKVNFGIALFLTILVDEVCYTYYKQFYVEFKALTNYPKFIGNCPAGCSYHLSPSDIFLAMNYGRISNQVSYTEERLDFRDAFIEAIPVMEREVLDFFQQHFTKINGNDFWQKCYNELPYKLKNTLL